ncbi:MAG: rRNA maturation RNase YbeY [Synergistaceae bacterium]|nr:rRNA maturation RNase YbeY [Synergistaceae bacterium]
MKLCIKIDSEGNLPSPFPADAAGKLESVFEAELPLLCRELENHAEIEFSVSFLDRAEMRDINKQYRGFDEPTDVLAFPLWEKGDFTPFGVLPLGDVVICPEEAGREHAPMPRLEALCLVLAHGFLHLLGWDHDTPEKEDNMWERQELLKSKLLNAVERGDPA